MTATTTPFSTLIRAATQEQHARAEASPFMADLLGGRLGVAAYARYTEQLYFVYAALEAGAAKLAGDPVAGPFLRPELTRLPALERDLDHLSGPGWRRTARPLPATAAYAARVTEVASDWPAGYVAHHYTRYLGDLSGGQVVRGIAERTWGLEHKGDGVRFYVFEELGSPAAFKREYREALDAFAADEAERERVVEECRTAFTLNTAVFADLGGLFPHHAQAG
ncbi:biliverdin-producing heme oxygenase [Streptomyces sp. SL13]|uniref:Biliverdin-producing heme oxygenase n=1 Tax=Streptantibioticus silvisoli TaxID=2705255 RepID=A0AA90GZI0_9ACTN|nr:biliverdin-producing heme oxygenase [Streptantibioticus silvisoli]MDI5961632.1 biliverdin-producing heme oxygenase [Streptantibioticus silvisoli]MDI5968213.1 biliverdin-producing heme oxygenase [Streptantibioticus silvisoli]